MTTKVSGDQFRDKNRHPINRGWLKWHGYDPKTDHARKTNNVKQVNGVVGFDCRPHSSISPWAWSEPEPTFKNYINNTREALERAKDCRDNPDRDFSDWDRGLHIKDAEYWLEKAERILNV